MKYLFSINEIKNYLYIIVGTFILSLGIVFFFISNSITTGGTPGMALLIHHISNFSIGTIVLLINIPLLIIGIKYLGKLFAIKTIISIVLLSFFIDLLNEGLKLNSITENILLASIFGGICIGVGVGLILRGEASAGGSTIIAKIIASKTEIKPGQIILFIDFLIIISSIYVFKDVDKALWSIMSIYTTSKCIDIMLTGSPSSKVVHISTIHAENICKHILNKLGHHGTILKGTELTYQKNKEIIFIVVELKKLRTLRDIIKENDPDAFMIVMEASEMLGRGH